MATSLVSALHAIVETPITLVGGHDGIYEVSVDGETIYSNGNICTDGFPEPNELADMVAHHLILD